MAITTYDELKTAIASWTHRDDLTDNLADFIALAEARMNDMLILRDMETEGALVTALDTATVALPDGYVSPLAAWIVVDDVRTLLAPATPEELPYGTTSGVPTYWAIDGDNIRFDCPADAIYDLPFRYVKASNLSDSNTTNQLLTKRPDVYLAACLVEAAKFTRDADLFNAWEPKFVQAVRELKAAENRARGMVPLRTDVAGVGQSYNIYTG